MYIRPINRCNQNISLKNLLCIYDLSLCNLAENVALSISILQLLVATLLDSYDVILCAFIHSFNWSFAAR